MLTTVADPAADSAFFADWRRQELARVDAAGLTYLDYTGAALAPASLLRAEAERLQAVVLGNPHSAHLASQAATNALEEARAAILAFLNADPSEYAVVLTANASAACRLVGEGWRFGPGTRLVLSADNHNSVNGIREFARRAGTRIETVPLDPTLRITQFPPRGSGRRGLFCFPAQSNFSGVRHPLDLVQEAHARGWEVLLDAAALLHASDLNLRQVQPEFVPLSLYKIAGHPGGLGALVVRRDALSRLVRPWFAGGTVEWASVALERHRLRPGAEGFEDGTPAFLAAGAVAPALESVQSLGRARLGRHLAGLTRQLLAELSGLRHLNGRPAVRIYGPADAADRGATVALNLVRPDGRPSPFWEVEAAAATAGLAIRGGCFCNPGCSEAAFGWPIERAGRRLRALGAGFTVPRFAAEMDDYPVGALRLSLGAGSGRGDVAHAIRVLGAIVGVS